MYFIDTIKYNFIQEREINWNFTGCYVPYFMIVLLPYINLLNFFFYNKMSIFEEYGAFNTTKLQKGSAAIFTEASS